jgi:hypothetical protein
MKKTNPADGWDGDYDISTARYSCITEIPGYKLRKPIEIAMFEETDRGLKVGYRANHTLPTDINDKDVDNGVKIHGKGKTEESACRSLERKLAKRFVNPKSEPERQYLSSIMVPK